MTDVRRLMRRLTIALINIDEIYCSDTLKLGVKESMLWLLYALDDGAAHSQKDICGRWGFPKTTLNTTIKQAEKDGHLTLSPIPGKRREMTICLTEQGKSYAQQVLRPIYAAEDQAIEETLRRYSAEFVEALEYFGRCMKSALEKRQDGDKRRGHEDSII